MSDLFLKDIPRPYIDRVFEVMEQADHHVYQILTKRSSRMGPTSRNATGAVPSPVTSGRVCRWRILRIPAASGICWTAHPASSRSSRCWRLSGTSISPASPGPSWAEKRSPHAGLGHRNPRHLPRDGVAFFFKQWGGPRPKSGGRELDGREWNGFPHPERGVALSGPDKPKPHEA